MVEEIRELSSMRILQITIDNLRVFPHLEVWPETGINYFCGGNGAGKTTILEAIYLSSRGRSFRHPLAGPMIRHGSVDALVGLKLLDSDDDNREHRLGLKRSKSVFECRFDGRDITKRSELAALLPTQWISSQPQALLEGGPGYRRQFVDMGLFHVEQDFLRSYAELRRVLRQRNALLKQRSSSSLESWDSPFALAAQKIHAMRQNYIADLLLRLSQIVSEWDMGFAVSSRYLPGWDPMRPLSEQLREKRDTDLRMGFTHIGPQRADLRFSVDGADADKLLSRGQQKMLVIALNIAQVDAIRMRRPDLDPVILLDDLNAELDTSNQGKVLAAFRERRVQAFVTGISDPPPEHREAIAMFHVEHAAVDPGHET